MQMPRGQVGGGVVDGGGCVGDGVSVGERVEPGVRCGVGSGVCPVVGGDDDKRGEPTPVVAGRGAGVWTVGGAVNTGRPARRA
jgi:hypothetical protein